MISCIMPLVSSSFVVSFTARSMIQNSKSEIEKGAYWSGLIPVDDTKLYVIDTGGSGITIIYLNGQFATQWYWRKVIAELGTDFRHITFDERARGRKSGTSS